MNEMTRIGLILILLIAGFYVVNGPMPASASRPEPLPVPIFFGCIDFFAGACADLDRDGWLGQEERKAGSDPSNALSTPEYALLDEQSGLLDCRDGLDNDLDGKTDRGDVGCRLTCRDFGAKLPCMDEDRDGWLSYVEQFSGSNPADYPSTPEVPYVGRTCSDGVDNDLDGLIDSADCIPPKPYPCPSVPETISAPDPCF